MDQEKRPFWGWLKGERDWEKLEALGCIRLSVRLKVRVRRETGKGIITSAVVNTYFASDEPLLLVPFKTAEKLGLEGARMEEFEVAGGGTVSGLRLKGSLEIGSCAEG